jgi:hypothetical protein
MRWFFGLFRNVQCRNCIFDSLLSKPFVFWVSFKKTNPLITDPCSLRCPHICRETFPGDCNHDVHKMTHSAESERFGLYGCSIFLHGLLISGVGCMTQHMYYRSLSCGMCAALCKATEINAQHHTRGPMFFSAEISFKKTVLKICCKQ